MRCLVIWIWVAAGWLSVFTNKKKSAGVLKYPCQSNRTHTLVENYPTNYMSPYHHPLVHSTTHLHDDHHSQSQHPDSMAYDENTKLSNHSLQLYSSLQSFPSPASSQSSLSSCSKSESSSNSSQSIYLSSSSSSTSSSSKWDIDQGNE